MQVFPFDTETITSKAPRTSRTPGSWELSRPQQKVMLGILSPIAVLDCFSKITQLDQELVVALPDSHNQASETPVPRIRPKINGINLVRRFLRY